MEILAWIACIGWIGYLIWLMLGEMFFDPQTPSTDEVDRHVKKAADLMVRNHEAEEEEKKKTKRTAADWTQKERDRFVSGNITRWW